MRQQYEAEKKDIVTNRSGKYLTFTLDREEYGIGILKVKEIIGMMPIIQVPKTPSFVKGIINLRGKVIPIVDLRLKFGMNATGYTDKTCIIVVEINIDHASNLMGLVVDAVSEVLNIKEEEIEVTPRFGVSVDTKFILGIAKTDHGVKMLLEINRVLTSECLIADENAA